MAATYTRRINLYINGKQVTADIVSIRKEMSKLVNEQARMTIGSKEYIKHTAKIKELKTILDQHNQDLSTTHKKWNSFQRMADAANRYFAVITAGIAAVAGMVATVKGTVTAFAEYDDKLVDVMKTTDLTKKQTIALNDEMRKIDTRTAQLDLLELARVAGKLGIRGKEDVLGFVRATDKIRVALSEDLGGDTEESVRQLGKLVDIFKLTKEHSVEDALIKIGSAMNALGASGTANEGYMLEFTKRVAGVAPTAGITIDKILGLATTLDELGQTSEVSGTAFNQVISKMFKNTAQFARIAGMELEEFTKLINEDANEAMIQLLIGAKGSSDGFGQLANSLSSLGMDGVRATTVLGVLAANIDKLRENQKFSNEEFKKGNSLLIEFNKKNASAQARLEKAFKRFKEIQVQLGESLTPIYASTIHKASTLLKIFGATVQFLFKYGKAIVFATGYLITYTIAVKAVAIWEARKNTAVGIGLVLSKLQTAAYIAQFAAIALYNAGVALLTGNIALATTSLRAFSVALNATPIGWVFTGIALLIGAIRGYDKYLGGATARAKEQAGALKDLDIMTRAYTEHVQKLNDGIKKSTTLTLAQKIALAEQSKEMIEAIENTIRLQKLQQDNLRESNTRATLWQKTVNLAKAGGNPYVAASYNILSAVQNGQEAAETMNDGIAELGGTMVELKGAAKTLWEITNAESIGDKIGTESLVMMNEKLAQYNIALENAIFGGKDYLRIQKKIEELQTKMERPAYVSDDEIKEKISSLTAGHHKIEALIRADFLKGRINEDEYNDLLLKSELDFMNAKLQIYNEGSEEYEKTINDSFELRIKNEMKLGKLETKFLQEMESSRIANIRDEIARQQAEEIQRWKVEKDALEKQMIIRHDLSAKEQQINANIHTTIQQKEKAHQQKLADIKNNVSSGASKKPWKPSDNVKFEISVLTAFHNKRQALIRQEFLENKITEDEYNDRMLKSELKFLADKLKIYNEGSKEYQEAVNQAMELQVKVDIKLRDLQLKAEQEMAAAKIENIRDEFARQEEVEKNRWADEKTALELRLIDKVSLNEKEQAINDALNATIEEKEKAHQQKMRDLKAGRNIADLENMVSATTPFDNEFAPPEEMQKSFDARAALVHAQYFSELDMAANNHAAMLAAEKKYNDAMLQLKLDMVDAEWMQREQRVEAAQSFVSALSGIVDQETALGKALFAFGQGLAIAEIWVNVAKANAKALAMAPITAGQPFITMNTAVGAAQTAMVLAQTVKSFAGPKSEKKDTPVVGSIAYSDGGYTPPGDKDDPAGIVHKGEYVVPKVLLKNPQVKYITEVFEKMRTRRVSLSQAAMPVLSSGGFTTQQRTYTPPSFPETNQQKADDAKNQNDINAELTKAIKLFMSYRPTVAVETIEREREKYIQIKQTKGL